MPKLAKALLAQSRAGDLLGRAPYLAELYASRVWRRTMNLFFGAYATLAAAEDAASRYGKTGWDDETLAKLLVGDSLDAENEVREFQPSYYPVFFWLTKLAKPNCQIVDLGGAGGIGYELFTQYSELPAGARWHVVDMPALIERGRTRHARNQSVVGFSDTLASAPDCDILFSAGCIQYMRDPLDDIGQMLDRPKAPSHIIINKLPLTSGDEFWTLQSLGSAIATYRIFNREAFTSFFRQRGYRIQDRWTTPELSVDIPFHSDKAVPHLNGLLFARD